MVWYRERGVGRDGAFIVNGIKSANPFSQIREAL